MHLYNQLGVLVILSKTGPGGKPSTWFPREWHVETEPNRLDIIKQNSLLVGTTELITNPSSLFIRARASKFRVV